MDTAQSSHVPENMSQAEGTSSPTRSKSSSMSLRSVATASANLWGSPSASEDASSQMKEEPPARPDPSHASSQGGGRQGLFGDIAPSQTAGPVRQRRPRSKSVPASPVSPYRTRQENAGSVEGDGTMGGKGSDEETGGSAKESVPEVAGGQRGPDRPFWFGERAQGRRAGRDWAARTEREYGAYRQERPTIAKELLRQQAVPLDEVSGTCSFDGCERLGVVKCRECLEGRIMCAECDEVQHPHAHFHHRSVLTADAYWLPISPTEVVVGGSLVEAAKCFSASPAHPCKLCGGTEWGPPQAVGETWAFITLEGRFDF